MFINKTVLEYLNHAPTKSQVVAIENLIKFLDDKSRESVFILKGYAGTGKTSLISALTKTCRLIKQKTVLMAPTGRAAKVLSSYADYNATTIHKCIYRKESTKNPDSKFVLNFKKFKNTLFIVDEASMISNDNTGGSFFGSGRLLEDLLQFVFNNDNCKLILVGDTAQLPPIGTILSPALDKSRLEMLNFNVYISELTDVVRQATESGILSNATILRYAINNNTGSDFPKLLTDDFIDIKAINGSELLDFLESSISGYGIEETKIVTRSNKYANKYNAGIRTQILWKEEEISTGDLLMVVKNNYSWLDENSPIDFIANGDIIEIKRIRNIQEIYGHRFADMTVSFIDYPELEIDVKVILDTLNIDGPAMSNNYYKELYSQLNEDYQHIEDSKKRHEAIMNDNYFNALQVKFAYAFTCHKSQGGQWKSVFIDYGWLTKEMVNIEFYRWLYTAFTRATEKLYLVNFDKSFFD